MRRSCRQTLAALAAVTMPLVVGACGNSGPTAPKAAGDGCPLSEASAKQLLHASTVVRGTPVPVTGVDAPKFRCLYSSADKSVQLTVFPGANMMKRFEPLVQTATTVATLGSDARCTRTTLGASAGASCLFIRAGDTYVLSAKVPQAAADSIVSEVTTLAEKLQTAR